MVSGRLLPQQSRVAWSAQQVAAEQKGLWDFAKFSLRWLFQLFLLRPRGWLEFLLFNSPPFSIHLWYLSAILYVLILMLLINPRIDRKSSTGLFPCCCAESLCWAITRCLFSEDSLA